MMNVSPKRALVVVILVLAGLALLATPALAKV
jgi:hypothetical protein